MYHYVYRVEHIEDNHFYIGSRSCECHPTMDPYLGSMSVWRPDKTKLKKEILKDDFETRDAAIEFEAEKIKEFIENPLNENYHIPNAGYHTKGTVTVKDHAGNILQVSINDPKYLSGELTGINKGFALVKDDNGNIIRVATSKLSQYDGITKNKVLVKYKNIELSESHFFVDINDPRYVSGELIHVWCNKKHTEKTKQKIRNSLKGKQKGKNNSQYGTMWIYNIDAKQNMKIKKEDDIPIGWCKGRMNF